MSNALFVLDMPALVCDQAMGPKIEHTLLTSLNMVLPPEVAVRSAAMVAAELVGNLFFHCAWGDLRGKPPSVRIWVTEDDDGQFSMHVRTRNPVNDPVAIERVQQVAACLDDPQRAMAKMARRLQEMAHEPLSEPRAGIGLLRLAQLGPCTLSATTSEPNLLVVDATVSLSTSDFC